SDKSTSSFRYLYQMPVLGGAPRQLVRDIDSAPTFSPDGQQIAFIRGVVDPSSNEIVIANSDGSNERVLVKRSTFSAGNASVTWSSDGKYLAFVSPETRNNSSVAALQVANVATGKVRDLHAFNTGARAAAWLPDGHGILVIAFDPQGARGQIFFVDYPEG